MGSKRRAPTAERNEFQARLMRAKRAAGQEIGEIPDVKDRIRRRDCIADFELFCKTYGRERFNLPWSNNQKFSAAKIQAAADGGGWYAFAMERGAGKSTLCEWAVKWVTLRGSHLYTVLIGANLPLATRRLKSIKTEISSNLELIADFPHALWPVAVLGNEPRRAMGQRYRGVRTEIEWAVSRVVMPWIEHDDSLCPGAVIDFGLEAALRGLSHTRPDGSNIRPSFAAVDDPQTRESA